MLGNCAAGDEGSPEWIVSYADMVTILMAFFVILYSLAGNTDPAREEAMLRSLRFNLGPLKGALSPLIEIRSKHATPTVLPQTGRESGGEPTREPLPRVARVTPGDPTAAGGLLDFEADGTDLSPESQRMLGEIVRVLAGKGQSIEVRGHASRRPLSAASPYRDAWELAFARCRKTMDLLSAQGIEAARMRLCVSPLPPQTFADEDPAPAQRDARVEVFLLGEFSEQSGDRGPRPSGQIQR